MSCPIAQLKSSPPVRERRGLISHWEHTFRSEFNVNGVRTTLEVRLVHCIGSVLDLEAVYTLMRSTSSVLVRDIQPGFFMLKSQGEWIQQIDIQGRPY